MNLSFSTRGWPELSWEEMMELALDMGFGGIEVYNLPKFDPLTDRSGPFHKYQTAATVRQLREKKLTIPCFDTSYDLSLDDSCLPWLKTLLEIAGDAHVPYVAAVALQDNEELVCKNLEILLKIARETGVTLLIKSSGIYADTARLRRLLDSFACDELAVLWDVHHPYRDYGESGDTTIKNLGDYVRHVHLRDSDDAGDYNLIGEGTMPIEDIMLALSSVNYDGFISLEWKPEWLEDIQDREVIFPYFVNYMSRFDNPRGKKKTLYFNHDGSGQYVWKKDELIDLTFSQVLDRMAEEFPDQYAVKYNTLDYTRTYAQFREDVDRFARALVSLGVPCGLARTVGRAAGEAGTGILPAVKDCTGKIRIGKQLRQELRIERRLSVFIVREDHFGEPQLRQMRHHIDKRGNEVFAGTVFRGMLERRRQGRDEVIRTCFEVFHAVESEIFEIFVRFAAVGVRVSAEGCKAEFHQNDRLPAQFVQVADACDVRVGIPVAPRAVVQVEAEIVAFGAAVDVAAEIVPAVVQADRIMADHAVGVACTKSREACHKEFHAFRNVQRLAEVDDEQFVGRLPADVQLTVVRRKERTDFTDARQPFRGTRIDAVFQKCGRIRADNDRAQTVFRVCAGLFAETAVAFGDIAVHVERIRDVAADPAESGAGQAVVFRMRMADPLHESAGLCVEGGTDIFHVNIFPFVISAVRSFQTEFLRIPAGVPVIFRSSVRGCRPPALRCCFPQDRADVRHASRSRGRRSACD